MENKLDVKNVGYISLIPNALGPKIRSKFQLINELINNIF